MGLDYQNEKEISEESEHTEPEMVQRAEPVTPYYSIILIACIVLVSIVQFSAHPDKSIMSASKESVLFAGFVKPLFWYGQYWRILTGATLHDGIIHWPSMIATLPDQGVSVDFLSNRSHLAIVFVLSAVGGGVLSLFFVPDIPSIGASGGVIGFLF